VHQYLLALLLALLAITGTGCTIEPVKPWEKDILAQKKMQLTPSPLEAYLDEHIYYSKEASSGGSGIGGGGCGCN
jgi:hypothetical protein